MEDIYATASNLRIRHPEPAPVLIMDEEGKPMVTVNRDHTVTLHQPDRVNEAARIFWRAIQWYGVAHCVTVHEGTPDAPEGPAV